MIFQMDYELKMFLKPVWVKNIFTMNNRNIIMKHTNKEIKVHMILSIHKSFYSQKLNQSAKSTTSKIIGKQ